MAFTYRITPRRAQGLSLIAAKYGIAMSRVAMLDKMVDEWITANPDVAASLSLLDAVQAVSQPAPTPELVIG